MNLFKRYMIVDSPRPFELSTVRNGYTLTDELCYWQQALWAVNNGLSRGWFVRELSTIPLGCRQQKNSLGLSTTKEFWANLNRLLNLFLIRIWSCWFLFLEELHACIKMGNCLLILYLVIDLFNKNSLSFCAEDVSKLPNLVKSCVLIFFFICFFLVFGGYSPVHHYSDVGDSNKWYIWTFRVRRGVSFGWSKSTWKQSTVSFGGKDLIFPI